MYLHMVHPNNGLLTPTPPLVTSFLAEGNKNI